MDNKAMSFTFNKYICKWKCEIKILSYEMEGKKSLKSQDFIKQVLLIYLYFKSSISCHFHTPRHNIL